MALRKTWVYFPKRTPSIAPLKRQLLYITADKVTCKDCPCFKNQSPYQKNPKLLPCLKTPLTLYELAAAVLDARPLPGAFKWSVEDVARWMDETVGFSQYRSCILDNNIDGMRLLLLEDVSFMPRINIRYFEHIKIISSHIHKLYGTDFIKFSRSIGLPWRLPLTYVTFFYSRTGPTWGIRQNWSVCDILRWMKILGPEPLYLDHWDLVWYQKPDFPKTMFARVKCPLGREKIPKYVVRKEYTNEYMVPRKFRMWPHLREEDQWIWKERLPGDPLRKDPIVEYFPFGIKKPEKIEKPQSRVIPKKINLTGLKGKDLILARRLMPKEKFYKC